eukprot:scaffold1880_cov128-Skeletonema_menzelii.AAC.12
MVMFVTIIASNQENFHPLYDAHHKSSQNLKYTADLAAKAVEPTVWACGKAGGQHENALDPITNQRPFFAFVHVYKTAGSTLRDFFRKYATICKKSLAIVAKCEFIGQAGANVEKCRLISSHNAPQSIDRVNTTPKAKGDGAFQSQVRHMQKQGNQEKTSTVDETAEEIKKQIFEHAMGQIVTSTREEEDLHDLFSQYHTLLRKFRKMDLGGMTSRPVQC